MASSMIRRLNKPILACILMLSGLGLLSLWQTAPPTNISGESITKSIFVKQVGFMAVGFMVMAVTAGLSPAFLRRSAWVLYVSLGLTLVALLVMGRVTRGARGWIPLGPFNLQPAEFMKIALVMTLARVLMYGRTLQRWRGLAAPILITAIPMGLVLLQPDLGTAILFVPALLSMLYAAGARKRHLAVIVIVLLIAAPIAYFFGLKGYQRDRLISFIAPKKVSADLSYQQQQSVKACSAGGFAGRGLGESGAAFPFYVPDRHTDFVYSIIAEQLGLVGSSFVLLLFGLYFMQSLSLARQSREPFARLMGVGLTAILATQTLINIGMTLGVAPITGVTLPFVSYGGSSFVTCSLAAGLVLNIGTRWQPGFSSRDMSSGSIRIGAFQPQTDRWLAR